jgi:enamine deaminase RidA (YjgF/YER057c/UK114 family)
MARIERYSMASIVKGPASTLIGVAALAHPGWLIEVEAIAVV